MSYRYLLFLMLCSFYSQTFSGSSSNVVLKFVDTTLDQIAQFWAEDGELDTSATQQDDNQWYDEDDEQQDSEQEDQDTDEQAEPTFDPFFEHDEHDPGLTYDQLMQSPINIEFDESGLIASVSQAPFRCTYFPENGCNKWLINEKDLQTHIWVAHQVIAGKIT